VTSSRTGLGSSRKVVAIFSTLENVLGSMASVPEGKNVADEGSPPNRALEVEFDLALFNLGLEFLAQILHGGKQFDRSGGSSDEVGSRPGLSSVHCLCRARHGASENLMGHRRDSACAQGFFHGVGHRWRAPYPSGTTQT